MTPLLTTAIGLYLIAWLAWFVLRQLLKFSIEVEVEDLRKSLNRASYEYIEAIALLRSLDAISLAICAGISPLGGVVLGMSIPDQYRAWLSQYIGPADLILITIVALFSYGAVFMVWKSHEGPRMGRRLHDAFLSKKTTQ